MVGPTFRVYYVNTIGCTSPSSCSHPPSLPCTAQEGRVTIDGVDVASLDGLEPRAKAALFHTTEVAARVPLGAGACAGGSVRRPLPQAPRAPEVSPARRRLLVYRPT